MQEWDKSLKKCLVHYELFFHSMVATMNRNGTRNLDKYRASFICQSENIVISLMSLITYIFFRYEKELSHTRWSTVRKGAVCGLYKGWLYFVIYIIYAVGFIFGSVLMSYEDQSVFNISDIIAVNCFSHK